MADVETQPVTSGEDDFYGYIPNSTWCIVFIVLFGVSAGESTLRSVQCMA